MAVEPNHDALSAAAIKSFAAAFGSVLELAPDSGLPLWVDGRAAPPKILTRQPDDAEASCQWNGAREALVRAIAGARAFESAYVSGRVSIAGDMSVMARISLDENR